MPLSDLFRPKDQAERLVEWIAEEATPDWGYQLQDSAAGQKVLALDAAGRRAFVLAAIQWLRSHPLAFSRVSNNHAFLVKWRVQLAALQAMSSRLDFSEDDLVLLLEWAAGEKSHLYRGGIPQIITALKNYQKECPLSHRLVEKIQLLIEPLTAEAGLSKDVQKWIAQLKGFIEPPEVHLPLEPGEAWADTALKQLANLPPEQHSAWAGLLNACFSASGSVPSAKFLKAAAASINSIGCDAFKAALLAWLPLTGEPRTQPLPQYRYGPPDPEHYLSAGNVEVLKGLAWACSLHDDPDLARALGALAISSYRKVPGLGPRWVRLGNACIWALGAMPGESQVSPGGGFGQGDSRVSPGGGFGQGVSGTSQLALLKSRLKSGKAQAAIDAAFQSAAKRAGLDPKEIAELTAPTFGLEEVGLRCEELGEYRAELKVTGASPGVLGQGTSQAELAWLRPDGKRQASVPAALKQQYPEEVKELVQAAKDIQAMLPAQRDRIESLYLEQVRWPLETWRERYLDHPLLGTLARRLIWKFTWGDQAASGLWLDGKIVGRDSQPLDWLDAETQVELWYPLQVPPEIVLEWRQFLAAHEIQQPFKQAHREVYLLTDAEAATRTYSNRFAAHIVRQHQFHALCTARGWKSSLRLMVDAWYPPPARTLARWNLRAEFWVDTTGGVAGVDTSPSGAYLYLATDQVRFYPLAAVQAVAHAWNRGYALPTGGEPGEPLPLETIPPLVFSEIMRDVDLFVGVASVGNDPTWNDGGPEGRYMAYWHSYSFGDLSVTAVTRKQVLEQLVPRLKIADRCSFKDRFLVVRGDLRTYKIHLGSSNILMEPNDQYLCIVPSRRTSDQPGGKVFLPFEGDQTLAVILSKAFMLAEDKKITDPTIIRQIKR